MTSLLEIAKRVLSTEAQAINALTDRIDQEFVTACQLILETKGRVVVTGMGKSGHIGNKIAATLASTGTPAFFVHAGEAAHGDLGMITHQDIVLAISNSGKTAELVTLLPLLKHLQIPLLSMTGNSASPLAQAATIHFDISVAQEACPLNLTPTASTTAALAMGDALAIALLKARDFTPEDFAFSHPAGSLGKRLLLKVSDVMRHNNATPIVRTGTKIKDAIMEISSKNLGVTVIADTQNHLAGIFTDGDLRRVLNEGIDIHQANIDQVMTRNCKTITPALLAFEALEFMYHHKITALPVLDDNSRLLGIAHIHDLLNAGLG